MARRSFSGLPARPEVLVFLQEIKANPDDDTPPLDLGPHL